MLHNAKFFNTTTFIAGIIAGTGAWADITPTDIWTDFQDLMKEQGYTVTATVSQSGDTLAIQDMVMRIQEPDIDVTVSFPGSVMDFVAVAPDRVNIEYPEKMTMSITADATMSESAKIDVDLIVQGNDSFAQGSPDDIRYQYNNDKIVMSLAGLDIPDEDISTDDLQFDLVLSGLKSTLNTQKLGTTTKRASDTVIGDMMLNMAVANPDDQSSFDITGSVSGLALFSNTTMPDGANYQQIAEAVKAGLTSNFNGGHSGLELLVKVKDPDMTGQFALRQASSGYIGSMSADGLMMQGGSAQLEIDVVTPMFPLPFSGQIEKVAYDIALPIEASDTEQDIKFAWGVNGLNMSEALWSMADPMGALVHDPIDFEIDLAASGLVQFGFLELADIGNNPENFDPEKFDPETFGQIDSVRLNALNLSALGGSITGSGAAEFIGGMSAATQGEPKMDGSVKFIITGLNAVMEDLVNAGLIPSDQVMMARMMMGAFLAPTGDDEFTSEFKVTPDGALYANGQRMR